MSLPLVSIIIPSYNHERFIEESIRSVLSQDYPNIELIVIDDASRDKSPEIIAQLAKQYKFKYLQHEKNAGLTRTLNEGLSMANGEYVCPFSSDDIMLSEKTSIQVEFMEKNPSIAACGGSYIAIDNDGNPRKKQSGIMENTFDFGFDDIFVYKARGIIGPISMIRTASIKAIGGYNTNIELEDLYLWLKLTSCNHRLARLKNILIKYRTHPTNSSKKLAWMYENILRIYEEYSGHAHYHRAVTDLKKSYFVKASEHEKNLAKQILKTIALKDYDRKVVKGILRLLFAGRT
jgi:alpha-1,3-rhamnosyltransferase